MKTLLSHTRDSSLAARQLCGFGPSTRGTFRRLLSLAAFMVVALAMSGCVGVNIEPKTIVIKEAAIKGQGIPAKGKLFLIGPEFGAEVKFDVTAENIVGKSPEFFTKVGLESCVGEFKVKAKEVQVCEFEVNAVAGSYSSGLTAKIETTGTINGKAAGPLFTNLEME